MPHTTRTIINPWTFTAEPGDYPGPARSGWDLGATTGEKCNGYVAFGCRGLAFDGRPDAQTKAVR